MFLDSEELPRLLEKYLDDPVLFVVEQLQAQPDPWQEEALRLMWNNPRVAIQSAHGCGKELGIDMPVLTLSGWIPIGDIKVGDHVIDWDGNPVKVTGVFPQGIKPLFKMSLDDDSNIICGLDHLWWSKSKYDRRFNKPWVVRNTKEIMDNILLKNGKTTTLNYQIPTINYVKFKEIDLLIDPYLLGIWLSDGSVHSGRYTDNDEEIKNILKIRGSTITNEYKDHRSSAITFTIDKLSLALKKLELLHTRSYERFIPKEYLYSSFNQRVDLLQGLIDTDGYLSKNNGVVFETTSIKLSNDIIELVRGLGGIARKTEKIGKYNNKICRKVYRIWISLPDNIKPSKTKKLNNYNPNFNHKNRKRVIKRFIKNIEFSHYGEAVCISVDSPTQSYITKDYIVTHNTATLAWSILAFVACHPMSKIPTTAPNFERQVRGILWSEIHKWFRRSKLLDEMFKLQTVELRHKIHKEEWYAVGFSVDQTENDEEVKTMEGYHAPYFLAVIDEAKGVSDGVFQSVRGAMSSANSHFLVASTPPLDPVGAFVDAVTKQRSIWKVVHISAIDSPRTSKEEIELHKKEWGEDSALYQAKVLGMIPKAGSRSFYPVYLVDEAMDRQRAQVYKPNVMGVDVAFRGDDYSAFAMRSGFSITNLDRLPLHLDPMALAGAIIQRARSWQPERIQIDCNGVGAGVFDRVKEIVEHLRTSIDSKDWIFKNMEVFGINVSEKADDEEKYINSRAELHDRLRMGMVEKLISLPRNDILYEEMSDIGYKQGSMGRLQIESKEDMRRRGKSSPDLHDSILMTLWNPPEIWTPKFGGISVPWMNR